MTIAIVDLVTAFRIDNQDYEIPEDTKTLIVTAIKKQMGLGKDAYPCGLLCVQWKHAQQEYFCQVGSRKCEHKWAATLATKLIELTNDMWKHRNNILHNKDNIIREQEHQTLNDHINYIYSDLPKSLWFFSHAEQLFFKKSDKQNLKKCRLYKKRQWIRKANTFLCIYRRQQELNPQTQTLYQALGVTPTRLHRQQKRAQCLCMTNFVWQNYLTLCN